MKVKAPPKMSLHSMSSTTIQPILKAGVLRPVTEKGEYLHWDKLRHLNTPHGLSSEQWWFATKLARNSLYRPLNFKDKSGKPFFLAITDLISYKLHLIDRKTGSMAQSPISALTTDARDIYLVQSLTEEAITSSQLEGAATTRKVAKEMLRTKRKPRDVNEQMIFNNYQAMEFICTIKDQELTVNIILELHRILTQHTLDDADGAGKIRKTDDVHIFDKFDEILHTPPKANELEVRLKRLCEFANAQESQDNFFIHPVIKAILLHFVLAYDHPFVDGNGRTARALFYWSMAHQGYWLAEFISISEIIKRAPSEYARAYLYTETDDNDVTYFILHQLDVILQAIDSVYKYINKETGEINKLERSLHANSALKNKLNYRQISLIKHALKHPHAQYQIEDHRQFHNVTYQTARTDLLGLAKLNLLLKQQTGKAFIFIVPHDLKSRLSF